MLNSHMCFHLWELMQFLVLDFPPTVLESPRNIFKITYWLFPRGINLQEHKYPLFWSQVSLKSVCRRVSRILCPRPACTYCKMAGSDSTDLAGTQYSAFLTPRWCQEYCYQGYAIVAKFQGSLNIFEHYSPLDITLKRKAYAWSAVFLSSFPLMGVTASALCQWTFIEIRRGRWRGLLEVPGHQVHVEIESGGAN